MAAGFGLLRLSPGAFWSMTPRELERAMSTLPKRTDAPPGKDHLVAMMALFPDKSE